jgi:drug/metabolite transporter (DMT)-like permease
MSYAAFGYESGVSPGVGLGLASAASFGMCDFVAGLASRRSSFWWVTLLSLVTSVSGAWVVVGTQSDSPTAMALIWGVAGGLGAAVGASALYRGYGRGQMAVAGPISSVGAAALPAVVGAVLGERLAVLGIVGVVLALPGIWLMSSVHGAHAGSRAGTRDGCISGVGFALEFVGLQRAGDASGFWPVAASQSTALALVALIIVIQRPSGDLGRHSSLLAVAAGVFSLLATGLYFLASHAGFLTVAAVLASLYPGVTVLLAAVFLNERPDRRQIAGLLLGAAAVTLLVTGG